MRTDRNLKRVSLRLLLIALPLSLPLPAHSATLFVSPDGSGTDGLSWETALNSVQEGILAAGSGDQVWVKSATYVENVTIERPISLLGGFAGNESAVSERNWVSNATILAGSLAGSVIKVVAGADCRIDGFHITNGSGGFGGGVTIESASVEISHSKIYKNGTLFNPSMGGGIGVESGFLALREVFVFRNQSLEGGGIALKDSEVILKYCKISENSTSGVGAGVYIINSTALVMHCTFKKNQASASGGGLYYREADIYLQDCEIQENTASRGGGLRSYNSSTLIQGCKIQGNSSRYGGGCLSPSGFFGQQMRFIKVES